VKAFILAGGRSSRMGRDKALVEFQGRRFIEHALAKLGGMGLAPAIAGNRLDLAKYAPVIPDNYPGSGPLAGIEAALTASSDDLNLFLPLDLPLLPWEFLRWMAARAGQTFALATIPHLQGRPQPLCAVYSRAMLPYARAALAGGDARVMRAVENAAERTRFKIDGFDIETVACSVGSSAGWPSTPPVHRWFQNLNTPADLETAALEELPVIH
jgi:molybdenum cofactor guanylyltransferase